MGYSRRGEKVSLELTSDEYDQLLLILGYALGARMHDHGHDATWDRWLVFVNNLNAGNPRFVPYEVPE